MIPQSLQHKSHAAPTQLKRLDSPAEFKFAGKADG